MCAKNIYVCTTLLLLVRTTYICATYHIHMWREQAITEWSWWVTSNDACEPGEQLIVLANGDDESDLVGWSLLLLAATVRSSAPMPLGISDRNNMNVCSALFRQSFKCSWRGVTSIDFHSWCIELWSFPKLLERFAEKNTSLLALVECVKQDYIPNIGSQIVGSSIKIKCWTL